MGKPMTYPGARGEQEGLNLKEVVGQLEKALVLLLLSEQN